MRNGLGVTKLDKLQKTPELWNDALYLENYPDVREAVAKGMLKSGYSHFVEFGLTEGRIPAWTSKNILQPDWPWSEWLYIKENPDVPKLLPHMGITIRQHYEKIGRHEKRSLGFDEINSEFLERTTLPQWVGKEMMELSYIDPNLDLEAYQGSTIYSAFGKQAWGQAWVDASEYLRHKTYDFLFFLPWIKKGGADLAAIFHIQAASQVYGKIAVFTTENTDSEWANRLPDSVDLVPLGELFSGIELSAQSQLIYHMISALTPSKIHIINSHAAWKLLERSPIPLAAITDVYVSLYCYDYDAYGEPVGYARNIRKCISGVKSIFTDNSTFCEHLVSDIGIPRDMIHVLSHPVIDAVQSPAATEVCNKVLWASRLDRQKQPEILIEIARMMPGITFDVFGSGVIGGDDEIIGALRKQPNIIYRGPFNSPAEILQDEYRCFLYTAVWDGLPNMLLEIFSSGLLVIAPDIGGIKADIGEENCRIVKNSKSAAEYVQALHWVFKEIAKAEAMRLNGQKHVRQRHTFENFTSQLRLARYFD